MAKYFFAPPPTPVAQLFAVDGIVPYVINVGLGYLYLTHILYILDALNHSPKRSFVMLKENKPDSPLATSYPYQGRPGSPHDYLPTGDGQPRCASPIPEQDTLLTSEPLTKSLQNYPPN